MKKKSYFKHTLSCKNEAGFTLVELMVSMSLFTIVMFMCMGAILTILDANQKSKNLRSVMDNLNFSLEGMTRTIRFGTNYHCGTGTPVTSPVNCSGGNSTIYVQFIKGITINQIRYSLVGGCVARSINGLTNQCITSPDANITALSFRVYNSESYFSGDSFQPKVIIVVSGYVGLKANTRSSFTLETTVSQRTLDIQ